MKIKLRQKVSVVSSFLEIAISITILLSIATALVFLIRNTITSICDMTNNFDYQSLFATAMQLIIGVEFVKMIAKHTPESVIEVLLFVVAKRVIVDSNSSSLEVLWGVLAIAAIYAVKKYLVSSKRNTEKSENKENIGQ